MSVFFNCQVSCRLLKFAALASLFLATPLAATEKSMSSNIDTPRDKHTLVIGKTTANPKKFYRQIKPMADYVATHMKDLGITHTHVVIAKNTQQMIQYLQQGKVDWVAETPFSAILLHDKAEAEILLRRWKQGAPEYRTVFFSRKDSNINTLEDLKGKILAFEEPCSTSAYYIPASVLIRRELKLTQLHSPRALPPAKTIGYVFSGEEINTSTWVYTGLAAAGVYSNLDWEDGAHLPSNFKSELKIFHQTKFYPRGLELVRKGLDPEIKQRLKQVLLQAHNDASARDILNNYERTTRFDELDSKAWESLAETAQLGDLVRGLD